MTLWNSLAARYGNTEEVKRREDTWVWIERLRANLTMLGAIATLTATLGAALLSTLAVHWHLFGL